MVKGEIKTKDGTHIIIEGSEEEVKRILGVISSRNDYQKKEKQEKKREKNEKMSIADMLHELKEEGFFNKPRGLIEIKNALSEKGAIYEITTLSTQLIRQVRKRRLGRIKQEKKWKYVKRG